MTPESRQKSIDLALGICERFEGFRSKPYKCPAGVWTIGHGITRYPDGIAVKETDRPISVEQSRIIVAELLQRFQDGVIRYCPKLQNIELLAACTDLAYNIGLTAFGASTLCKAINNNGTPEQIAEQFRRWNKAGGKFLQGLANRREAEIALFIHCYQ